MRRRILAAFVVAAAWSGCTSASDEQSESVTFPPLTTLCDEASVFRDVDERLAANLHRQYRIWDELSVQWRYAVGRLRATTRGDDAEADARSVDNLRVIDETTLVLEVAPLGPGAAWTEDEVSAARSLVAAIVAECDVDFAGVITAAATETP